jgi:hypothetical protein
MKAAIITSAFWLLVLFGFYRLTSVKEHAQYLNFKSETVYPLSSFMDQLALENDAAARKTMAAEMGDEMKKAEDTVGVMNAIYSVNSKYRPNK